MIFHFWRMNLFCFWPWVARPCDVFYKKCILLHMKCSNVMYVFRIISAISRQFQTPSHVASGTCLLLCLLSMLKLLHNGLRKFMKFFNVKIPIMDPITKMGLLSIYLLSCKYLEKCQVNENQNKCSWRLFTPWCLCYTNLGGFFSWRGFFLLCHFWFVTTTSFSTKTFPTTFVTLFKK